MEVFGDSAHEATSDMHSTDVAGKDSSRVKGILIVQRTHVTHLRPFISQRIASMLSGQSPQR